MGLQIEYYTTSTGKELSVMTRDKKRRFYLEAYRNGEFKGELTVELYEESVYIDHIEVPNSVNNTLIGNWVLTP